ncbi:MAG: DUF4384 domain-containing protein [Thermodesulfobacteriota bacterium]
MRTNARWWGILASFWTVLALGTLAAALAAEMAPPELGLSLLHVGEVKAGAVELRVSTNTPAQGFFSAGDRVIITLEAPRELYLTVLHVSDSGDVTIFYPDKEKAETAVAAGEKLVLFGPKSNAQLVAGKELSKGGTVAFVSPRQFSVALMRFFQGKQWMEISGTAERDLKLLKEKLEIICRDKGFNRIEIPIKAKSGKNLALGITKQGRALAKAKSTHRRVAGSRYQ